MYSLRENLFDCVHIIPPGLGLFLSDLPEFLEKGKFSRIGPLKKERIRLKSDYVVKDYQLRLQCAVRLLIHPVCLCIVSGLLRHRTRRTMKTRQSQGAALPQCRQNPAN